jgi:FixJ family two-component response regulator
MLGVVDYLRKPFAMDVMLESVRKALEADDEVDAPPGTGPLRRSRPAKKKDE